MSRWLLCVTALWCASAVVCQEALPAPRFIVNLDLPPIQRWGPIVSKFQAQFAPIEQFIDELIPQSLQSLLVPLFADLDSLLPGEYPDEIRGAAAASGMELGKVVAMNLIYDFTAFCTSILAQQPNGTILHARNLDYDIPGLRNITIDVEFQRSNVTIYSCTTFAGYVGCLTGMRHGAWSFSVDQRMPANESILDNLFAAALGGQSLSLFLRTSLDQFTSFEDALPALASDPLIAPVYIIMAGVGPGEGAILTRNQTMAVDVWRLDAESGLWWILETNYDHWLPPPPDDDRRDPANKMMKAIGQSNITISGMYDVLSTPPVLNSGTKYTTQMIPATSSYYTHIRYDAPKDVPFLADKVARF